jgi:hypothetical protein
VKAFTFASVSSEGQPIEILPSGTTPDASTMIKQSILKYSRNSKRRLMPKSLYHSQGGELI